MKTLSYNEDFALIVTVSNHEADEIKEGLTEEGIKFSFCINKNAPKMIDFLIIINGMRNINIVNDILLNK